MTHKWLYSEYTTAEKLQVGQRHLVTRLSFLQSKYGTFSMQLLDSAVNFACMY